MREILFRGKRIDNGEWVHGSYAHIYSNPNTDIIITGFGVLYEGCDEPDEYTLATSHIDPTTIGQYTGLTDKNGKKIFEGDILKIVHKYQSPFDDDTNEYTDITTDVVHFDDEGLCFSYGKIPFLCVADNVTAEYEVVGNIHDNSLEQEG